MSPTDTATSTKTRKVEQGEATRALLMEEARELFARSGFGATTTGDIVERAEVTRGALYYHFRDKEQLFLAVFEALQEEVAERVLIAAARANDGLEALRIGFDAFLTACLDPAVQRIVLQDGPSVLGWDTVRELDIRHAFGLAVRALDMARAEGKIAADVPAEPLAHLLTGAVIQAGTVLVQAENPTQARMQMRDAFNQLLDGLAAQECSGSLPGGGLSLPKAERP